MIWILLLYVLPLLISILGAYWIAKKDGNTIGDFLEVVPYLLIPLLNILIIIVGIYKIFQEWWDNDEAVQNFKNRKL
jgi:ACR3 family arsenite efflux pump ArsB